jgi:hypothetical protein
MICDEMHVYNFIFSNRIHIICIYYPRWTVVCWETELFIKQKELLWERTLFISNGLQWHQPNVMVEWLTLLLRIREVLLSNLGPENGYPDWRFSWFSSVPPDKYCDSTLKSDIISNAQYSYHPITRRRLGGVVVSVIDTGAKGSGFKPGQSDKCLRAIKTRSKSSFGWEVKSETPCRKILRHVIDPLTCLRYWYAKFPLLCPFFLLAPRCLC